MHWVEIRVQQDSPEDRSDPIGTGGAEATSLAKARLEAS